MINRLVPLSAVTEPRVVQAKPSGNGEFTYVDISSIDNTAKRVVSAKRVAISRAPNRARQHLRAGDVVVSMTRPNLNAVALIDKELDHAVGTTGFDVLRATQGALPLWIYYAVQSPQFISAMCGLVQGILYPAVRPKDIRSYRIPLPPLDQQERIVAEIEKQFTRLDAGVASLKRVQLALKRYRASVLKAACEGRLVPTEAELARRENRSYETGEQLLQRILKERREKWNGKGKYKEPAEPNIGNLPILPEGWTWARIDQLAAPEANSITDGPFGSNLKTEHYTVAGPRIIRLQNIGDGVFVDEHAHISEEHFSKLQKSRVYGGDIVIAALGKDPPRSCIIPQDVGPAVVKADCIRFKPHADLSAHFINLALNSQPARNRTKAIIHGVGRPRLNLGEIKSIAIPLPAAAEQVRIVDEVEIRFSIVLQTAAAAAANDDRARQLRNAILQDAFQIFHKRCG